MELVSGYLALAPGFLFKLMLCIARYFQAMWRERAPFQKPVHLPSWRRRGRRWSNGMRWRRPNLVPIFRKTIGIISMVIYHYQANEKEAITFQHRTEGGIQCAQNILWSIICWKTFIWPSTCAVMVSKDHELSDLVDVISLLSYHNNISIWRRMTMNNWTGKISQAQ